MAPVRSISVLFMVLVALSLASCAARAPSATALVGTWKQDRLVFMFDPEGTCQRFNLATGAFESGHYTVKGAELDISFASGLGARYELHSLKSGELQVVDIPTGNRFMLTRVPQPGGSSH